MSHAEFASPPDAAVPVVSSPAAAPLSPARALRPVLALGLAFALVGLVAGLRVVSQVTLPHILQAGEYINFQDVTEGLPVPRLLAWDTDRIDLLDTLRGMGGFALLLTGPLVFGPLWLVCVRRVNPTFRLFGLAPTPAPAVPAAAPEPTAPELIVVERLADTPTDTPTGQADTASPPAQDASTLAVSSSDASSPDVSSLDVSSLDVSSPDAAMPDTQTPAVTPSPAPTLSDTDEDAATDYAGAGLPDAAVPVTHPDTPADAPVVNSAAAGSAAPFAPAGTLGAVVELYGLVKALTLLLMIGLPLAAVWILVDFEGDFFERGLNSQMLAPSGPLIGSVWLMRLVLLGSAFWVGFHRSGMAGDFTQPDWNAHSRRLFALGVRGALFGLLMYALCRTGLPQHLNETLLRMQPMGALTIPLWAWVTRRVLFCFGAVGFAIGALFALWSERDGRPAPTVRLLLWLLPAAGLGAALFAQRDLAPSALAARYDARPALLQTLPENAFGHSEAPIVSVPDGLAAAQQMAQRLHLPPPPKTPPPGRTLALFDQRGTVLVYQNSFDIDNLPADASTDSRITDFLRSRDYQTAFSWPATKHLFNAALIRMDNTSAMRAGILDLTHCPHNAQFGRPTLLPMLFVCAATPQNLDILNQWADPAKFETPDRNSKRLLGDLYRRFGRPDDALRWYRKADMPRSFLNRVSAEKPILNTGHIEGVLRLNQKPLTGAQVAVIPVRLNGLPHTLEETVLFARREIYASDASRINPAFGPLYPQPYSLRWISASATTDAQGAYRIGALTEGEYIVLVALPPDMQTRLPADDRLRFTHPPAAFTVNYRHPARDLGTTDITFDAAQTGKQP